MKTTTLILLTLIGISFFTGCKKQTDLKYKLFVSSTSTDGKSTAVSSAPVYDVDSVTYLSDKILIYLQGQTIDIERDGKKLKANLPWNGVLGENYKTQWIGKLNSESPKRGTKLYLSAPGYGMHITDGSNITFGSTAHTIQLQLR